MTRHGRARGVACALSVAVLSTLAFYLEGRPLRLLRASARDSGDCSATLCPMVYDPVCSRNKTFPNSCFAECELGHGGWSKGRCKADELNPIAGCIAHAHCSRDPCRDPWPTQCQNLLPKGAVCFTNPCPGVVLTGDVDPLEPCAAIWVDPATKQTVKCGGPATQPSCACPKNFDPVCSRSEDATATEYGNACLASCALGEGSPWTPGPCDPPSCICPLYFSPVCGSDAVTYNNECEARCALGNGGKWTDGPCPVPCICTMLYDPVCGTDGKTYGNPCQARCAGVSVAYPGTC